MPGLCWIGYEEADNSCQSYDVCCRSHVSNALIAPLAQQTGCHQRRSHTHTVILSLSLDKHLGVKIEGRTTTESFTKTATRSYSSITLSVFRLAARRTDLNALIPLLEPAPVSEKPVGLNRSPRPPGLWALKEAGFLTGSVWGVPTRVGPSPRLGLGSIRTSRIWPIGPCTGTPTAVAAQAVTPWSLRRSLSDGRDVDAGS